MTTVYVEADFVLLERWRAGQLTAGEQLFERHFAAMARFFRNKADDAFEDLVQRTFLACVEGKERIREGASFRGYLFGIAHNVLREHYRSLSKKTTPIDEATSLHDLAPRATTLLAARAEEELLLQGLRRLPIAEQMVLELRFWEDLRMREIAELTGWPEGTVASRIRRARHKLESIIAELTKEPDLRERTRSGLDTWAGGIRARLGRDEPSQTSATTDE